MLLAELVETSRQVGETRSRLAKVELLATLLRRLPSDEIEPGVAFLSGETRQTRTGIGWATLRDAAAGPVERPSLTVAEVDASLEAMASSRGAGSGTARGRLLHELLARATDAEQSFLRRLLVGELRQGAQEGILLDAIARATATDPRAVRRAMMLRGEAGAVAKAALAEGDAGLARFSLELFRPLQPMLAQTAETTGDALARFGRAAAEHKLDGARVQIHRVEQDVRVFSRQMNDVTPAVPEIVEAVRLLPARQVILDGEVIALRSDGSPLPFQTTMRRFGRRLDVDRMRAELPLSVQFFDCLHLDGDDLIDRGTEERWQALSRIALAANAVERRVVDRLDDLEAFTSGALARGHEGIMLKALDAPYEAGRRGGSWLKLKPTHTLDLVVLAVEWGSGRRKGWLSNLHLGARDPATGSFVMLGKTFKGMTDEMLRWQTKRLLELEIGREGHVVHVKPELVVEIAFDGVQTSPHYPGGLALRFARLKRYREDKRADEADTIDMVRALHARGERAATS